MPVKSHSAVIKQLVYLLEANPPGLVVFPDLRLRISPARFLVPGLSVFREEPAGEVPDVPPYAVIEVLSPDDRLLDAKRKLERFLTWGAQHVWLIDPFDRELFVQDASGLHRVQALELPECGVTLSGDVIFEKLKS